MKQAKLRCNKPLHLLPRAPGYLACATRFSDAHYRSLALALEQFDREQSDDSFVFDEHNEDES
jgi:hypothetical protein